VERPAWGSYHPHPIAAFRPGEFGHPLSPPARLHLISGDSMYLDDAKTSQEAVFQAIGAASVCWEHMDGTGVFDSDKAKEIGEELMEWMNRPRLGFATTLELLEEIHARVESTSEQDPFLAYRVVGGG